jgi:hypothetical protein
MSSLSDRLLGAVTWRSGAIGLAGFKMLEASIKQMCVAASSVVIPQVNEKYTEVERQLRANKPKKPKLCGRMKSRLRHLRRCRPGSSEVGRWRWAGSGVDGLAEGGAPIKKV